MDVNAIYATFWSLLPPVIAILLALITKEVYSSLFVGILFGGMLFSSFSFVGTIEHVLKDGFIASLSDSYNVGILVFLVILGALVSLMNKAGGSRAFGEYMQARIKTRAGAMLATMALGILIFIDDYFNCLTVGSVMRPVTDSHKVSRAKLAYIIDATAAPICIIAPVSSWAAAVSGFVEGEDGFSVFLRAIPYNYYALLTIAMMLILIITKTDFGLMKKFEDNAINKGDLFTVQTSASPEEEEPISGKGQVSDLLIPIISLIICCVLGMIYSGGFFSGTSFIEAFSNSDASIGLSLGSIFAIIITIIVYLIRKTLSFKECMESLPAGFKAMVPAILILTFAWTLKEMTMSLGAKEFVASMMENSAAGLLNLLPAIIFIVGCLLAFATGTSWGTFGILIPIVVNVFQNSDPKLMIISISACMAGAVCGDHCSPISDTTIMASAGAGCDHVSHVSTQLPYAVTAAVASFFTYIVAGLIKNAFISLIIGIVILFAMIMGIKKVFVKADE